MFLVMYCYRGFHAERAEFIVSIDDCLLLSFFIFLAITGIFIKSLFKALHEHGNRAL